MGFQRVVHSTSLNKLGLKVKNILIKMINKFQKISTTLKSKLVMSYFKVNKIVLNLKILRKKKLLHIFSRFYHRLIFKLRANTLLILKFLLDKAHFKKNKNFKVLY